MTSEQGTMHEIIRIQEGRRFDMPVMSFNSRLRVSKYDGDMTRWLSKKLGGEAPGKNGFIQPDERDFKAYNVKPYEVLEAHNALTQAGWGRILDRAFTAGTGVAYVSGTCRLTVGTATAAFTTGDTQVGSTGADRFSVMASAAPSTGTGTGTALLTIGFTTFASGEANFTNPWQEWVVDQGTATGTNASAVAPTLNRSVVNLGTKTSPATWTALLVADCT